MLAQLKTKTLTFLTLVLVSLSAVSCHIQMVADYDDGIMQQIETTAKEIDRFYLQMLEGTTEADGGRAYANFQKQYIDFEVELNSLLMKNKIKPLNESSTRICEITLELWRKYKTEHQKDNTLSNGIIRLNRKTFDDLFFAMQSAEKGKQISTNPPQ